MVNWRRFGGRRLLTLFFHHLLSSAVLCGICVMSAIRYLLCFCVCWCMCTFCLLGILWGAMIVICVEPFNIGIVACLEDYMYFILRTLVNESLLRCTTIHFIVLSSLLKRQYEIAVKFHEISWNFTAIYSWIFKCWNFQTLEKSGQSQSRLATS